MTTYDNGGMCECCFVHCMNCLWGVARSWGVNPWHHHPETMECPTSQEEADANEDANFRRRHEGFGKDEIEIRLNSEPPHPEHIFTDAFKGGVVVVHKATGITVVEEGKTYSEPLERAMLRLRTIVEERK